MDINLTLIGQSIAMTVFVWFCMKFIWPLITNMLEERRTQIADGLAAAEEGNRALQKAEGRVSEIVDEARGQARQIIDQANTRAGSIVDEARVGAGEERERILTAAQGEVEQEVNRARDTLRGQVGAIAVAGAEQILAREIDASAHRDLLDRLSAEI